TATIRARIAQTTVAVRLRAATAPWRCGPRKATTTAVPRGTNRRISKRKLMMRNAILFLPGKTPDESYQKHRQTESHGQRVELHQAVLNRAEYDSKKPRDLAQEINQAVHTAKIEATAEPCQTDHWPHNEEVEQLIQIKLIQGELVQPLDSPRQTAGRSRVQNIHPPGQNDSTRSEGGTAG